jgi:hypothetical protein
MKYVARFTETPEQDIERGWSGYFAPFLTDVKEALEDLAHVDTEEMTEDEMLEAAEENNLCQDPHTGAWRPFHHAGLSCWALEAETEADAMIEAAAIHDNAWGGFGQRTIGKVRLVGKVRDALYLFECEDAASED